MAGTLDTLTRKELFELARKAALPGRTKMSKKELIGALSAAGLHTDATTAARPAQLSSATSPAPVAAPAASPPGLAQKSYEDYGHALPLHYNQDKIVALARDPHWLFVYWELEGPKKTLAQQMMGLAMPHDVEWRLRVRNLTRNETRALPILLDSYNWYVRADDGCRFVVDLVLAHGMEETTLVSSKEVETPLASPSSEAPSTWAVVDDDFNLAAAAADGTWVTSPQLLDQILAARSTFHGMDSRYITSPAQPRR